MVLLKESIPIFLCLSLLLNLIELKQWSSVEATGIEGNFVETFTGGGKRVVTHPSQQVKGYHNYLLDFIEEFEKDPPLSLISCSYCHNYSRETRLFKRK